MSKNDQFNQHFQTIVTGNVLAKQWARKILGRRKLGRFLMVLKDPARAAALKIKPDQAAQIKEIPHDDQQAILATSGAVKELCEQYGKLTQRIAQNMARLTGRDNEADKAQLESEATVGLLKAIRSYSRLDVKFITYAYHSIMNEVSRYLQRNTTGLSGTNASLLVKHKKCQENLYKASLPHNFEDVCREMQLTDKQTKRLKDSIREVASESDLEESLAKLLLDSKPDDRVDAEMIRRIEGVSMSRLERDSWISQNDEIRSLFPDAFQSLKAVAETHGVTPQAASEALRRARTKLAASLSDWSPSER